MDMIHFNWHPLLIQSYWSSFKWRDLCKPRNTTWWKLSFSSFSGRLGSLNSRGNDSLIKRQLWYGNVSFGRERYCLLECPARDQPGDSWSDVGRMSLLETVILGLKTSTPLAEALGDTQSGSGWLVSFLLLQNLWFIRKSVTYFCSGKNARPGDRRLDSGFGIEHSLPQNRPSAGWALGGGGGD